MPGKVEDWIEAQVRHGEYASDYVRDPIRRDRARREQELTIDELRRKLAASRESGSSDRAVGDIFAQARDIARSRGLLRE